MSCAIVTRLRRLFRDQHEDFTPLATDVNFQDRILIIATRLHHLGNRLRDRM